MKGKTERSKEKREGRRKGGREKEKEKGREGGREEEQREDGRREENRSQEEGKVVRVEWVGGDGWEKGQYCSLSSHFQSWQQDAYQCSIPPREEC